MESRDTFLLSEVEPPTALLAATLARVHAAKQRAARVRLALFGSAVAVSGALLWPALSYALQAFYTSGFSVYLGLFFTDTSLAAAHWQEISLSLAESLPSIAVLVVLAVLAAFAWSVLKVVPVIRPALSRSQFA